MENQVAERSPGNVSETVKRVSARLWQAVDRYVLTIPVAKESQRAFAETVSGFKSEKLANVAGRLRKIVAPAAKALEVGAATADLVLAAVCGVNSLKGIKRSWREERARSVTETTPVSDAMFAAPARRQTKLEALKYGGLAGAILWLRPVSRLAFYSARLGGMLGERVARVIDTIIWRQARV